LIAGLTIQTRNPLFAAFFSLFAARFSIRLFAGFFFVSLFVSLGLLIAGSSKGGTMAILRQSDPAAEHRSCRKAVVACGDCTARCRQRSLSHWG
jgi:hypothetical protein